METIASADGTTLAFDRIGSGPPLILLAGATCTRGVTAPLAQALSPYATVFNLDRRGRGDSDDASAPPPYLVEREIEDIAALVQAAGGSAAVYGHSSGAGLALRAAAADIGVTRVIAHDAPYAQAGHERQARQWDVRLHAMLAADRPGDAIASFLTMIGMPVDMVDSMRDAPHWPALEDIAPTLAYDSAAMGDRDGARVPAAMLAGIDIPALVVVGGADHDFMLDIAHQIEAALPQGSLIHLVGARHDVGPDVLVPALLPFLTA